MNQLIYILLIIFISIIASLIYKLFINRNKILKFFLAIFFIIALVYFCYKYNYFIFNFYVCLSIFIGTYTGYIVKNRVKRVLFNKKNNA